MKETISRKCALIIYELVTYPENDTARNGTWRREELRSLVTAGKRYSTREMIDSQ